jgi:hypothetical protein
MERRLIAQLRSCLRQASLIVVIHGNRRVAPQRHDTVATRVGLQALDEGTAERPTSTQHQRVKTLGKRFQSSNLS